ncbi:MAG TPA: hypothetical protein VND87_04860 [Stellaceae bacterium]|nr:hypothetical protein [Stellaceae bacterium]
MAVDAMSDWAVLFFCGAALVFVLGIPIPRTWRNVLVFAVIAFALSWVMSSGITSVLAPFN